MELDEQLRRADYTTCTRACRAKALRQILRWLWQYHGAPKLDDEVRTYPNPRPRNVTATQDEKRTLIEQAEPHLKLWLLLCSDLAIRSGTAINIAPHHYDSARALLRFTTKCDEHQTLPVTAEIEAILRQCDPTSPHSYVRQLWAAHNKANHKPGCPRTYNASSLQKLFRQLRTRCGITRKLTLHDLRRTTAVAMLKESGDVRDVQSLLGHKSLQSTIWYLDHDIRPVNRATLETIKRPFIVPKERTA